MAATGMRCFVTGCAGFVGSNLVDRLLEAGHSVRGYDNFSTGRERFLDRAKNSPVFNFVQGDVLDMPRLTEAMHDIDIVFHFAANADVRFGIEHPRRDLEQNTLATFNVLEAMRLNGVKRIVFSSTGSIYGEPTIFPTPEDAPFPVQTSLYGASKLAGEGLIQAYSEGFGFQSTIFRFVSLLGERYTHGHVVDFYAQLRAHPDHLDILGNGHQKKSYLYIQDCIDAILLVLGHEQAQNKINIFNLGTDQVCEVKDSIGWITQHLGLTPELRYSGGERGWIGDSPFIFLNCSKVRSLGWRPKLTIMEGIHRTVAYLEANAWVLERT
jgi:UDP-glucose 4-epimerase